MLKSVDNCKGNIEEIFLEKQNLFLYMKTAGQTIQTGRNFKEMLSIEFSGLLIETIEENY